MISDKSKVGSILPDPRADLDIEIAVWQEL